jgi:hypothetical protein
VYSGEYDVCDVTLSLYPHRASLKNMLGHGGNRTYDLCLILYILSRLCFFLFQAREREMLQKLEEKDGESYQMKETHSTLQEEVDIKTKKLKKV